MHHLRHVIYEMRVDQIQKSDTPESGEMSI
jgi:hypothetical protein